jgi:hypothetical protein
MPWTKGERGNPRGRAPGSGEVARLRAAIAEHVPEVILALIEAAKKGDVGAARLILERTVPALKPEELPIEVAGFCGSRTELVAAVVEAVATGRLDTARGGRLISQLTPSELDERITRVEKRYEQQQEDANDEH